MKKCYWKCWLSPSNRPNQQIKPYPTRWHYPLITYLTLTCSSIIESISENEINQHDMEHSLIFILFEETLDIHKYFVWIYIDSDGLKIEHQSRDIHIQLYNSNSYFFEQTLSTRFLESSSHSLTQVQMIVECVLKKF